MATPGDKLTLPVSHEQSGQGGVFFMTRDGRRVGEMTYRRVNASLVNIDHTLVDGSLRGRGAGRALLDAAVEWARRTQTKLTTTCSFAAAHFARDRSIRDVLA